MAVLEIDDVTKIYKSKGKVITAVKNVSFTVDKGEVVGFIGQNGAGKSTTIKIACGLAEPTSGTVRINGFDIKKDRVKALSKVGCIVETPDLYKEWSAMKNLEYLASISIGNEIKGEDKKRTIKNRSEELLKMVGLFDRKDDLIRKYSLGMKQRVGIAQALLSKPDLLILDEPTNGLDPSGIKEVRDVLHKLSKEYGMAVLVSSHLLSEIQMVCDKYVIIDKGRITGTYEAKDLQAQSDGNVIDLITDDVVKAKDALRDKFGLECEILGNGKVEFVTEKPVNEIAKELILCGINVLGITQKEITLEELFMKVTRENTQGEKAVKAERDDLAEAEGIKDEKSE